MKKKANTSSSSIAARLKERASAVNGAISKYFDRIPTFVVFIAILVLIVCVENIISEGIQGRIGAVSDLIGVTTALLAYFSWAEARRYRIERDIIRNKNIADSDSICLIIQSDRDIVGDVKKYIENSELKNVFPVNFDSTASAFSDYEVKVFSDESKDSSMPKGSVIVFSIPRMPSDSGKKDDIDVFMVKYSRKINEIKNTIKSKGVSKVHLFSNIPISLGFYTGGIFKNNFLLVGYHFDANGTSCGEKYCRIYDMQFEEYAKLK